ncbi:MAG: PorT family protein [Paludibacteraceae bacterium]|nr:PorT family protein [Paludibacteraceae bacterium]MBR6105309.1 PorT family protein [Paludibacteraceae bacterium]
MNRVKRAFVAAVVFAITASTSAFAQSAYKNFGKALNLINADNKQYHFGFILGFNAMDFDISQSKVTADDGKIWYADVTSLGTGFTVGIISDLRLGEYFDLRFNPVLMFNDRTVHYVDQKGKAAPEDVIVKSSIIDLPLLVKMRAQRMRNFRPYLIAGPAATIDLSRSQDCNLLLKQLDYGVEFGVGCDIYLPYFKLAPEFKMFMGFNDMIDKDRPDLVGTSNEKWQNAINKLTSRLFTLTFNFE